MTKKQKKTKPAKLNSKLKAAMVELGMLIGRNPGVGRTWLEKKLPAKLRPSIGRALKQLRMGMKPRKQTPTRAELLAEVAGRTDDAELFLETLGALLEGVHNLQLQPRWAGLAEELNDCMDSKVTGEGLYVTAMSVYTYATGKVAPTCPGCIDEACGRHEGGSGANLPN